MPDYASKCLPKCLPDCQIPSTPRIYSALGDVHFRLENYEKALKCFQNSVQCPGGLGNPYIHLRLGQLYFERDQLDNAADELTRAYMGGGIDIFMEDDPRYLAFLETRISL